MDFVAPEFKIAKDVCTNCDKVSYSSKKTATSTARHFKKIGQGSFRAYWSKECQTWHLASERKRRKKQRK